MPDELEPQVHPDSPPDDATAASSAEHDVSQPPVSESAPPPPSQPEPEKRWHLPPEERWEELRREREEWKQTAQQLASRLQQPAASAPPSTPDPWEPLLNHQDPQTAQFYQQQKRLADHIAQTTRQQVLSELQPVLDAGRQEIARLNTERFREKHPDIKPGSEDERQIVRYMMGEMDGTRHSLESAKRNALYDKLEAENRALKTKRSATPQKVAANATEASAGIPQTAGLPGKPADWRDRVRETHQKGGSLADIANAMLGR